MRLPQNSLRVVLVVMSVAVAAGAVARWASRDPNRPGHVVPYGGPPMSAAEPTKLDLETWAARWDEEIGLWWQHHPGHTPPVAELEHIHPAPSATARLLVAAQARQLGAVDVTAVLGAIRRMQVLNGGPMHGCLRWYWEEKWPVDHNASFFAGLSLIVLDRCYADQFSETQRVALRQILTDLCVFFTKEAAEREFRYPNRYLGDLVGAWLIAEIAAGDAEVDAGGKLRGIMLEAADYWTKQDWGWGEHLSDMYAGVCLDELSVLLLFSRRLPDDVRARYKALFDELLAIEDAFGGCPRVPAIRSYAFGAAPMHTSYRDLVRPLPAGATSLPAQSTPLMPPEIGDVFQHRPPLGATLSERGWHDFAPPRTPQRKDVLVPAFGGATAAARVEPDIRLGSLSRFPLMPDAEAPKWGMSWQSFPVAYWRRTGEWGFLQWESRQKDRVRAHPAVDIIRAYHDNALTTTSAQVTVGRTYTIQRGGNLIALRVMPALPSEWDRLTDRLRLVDVQAEVIAPPSTSSHARLLLRYPEREMSMHCIPISAGATVAFHETGEAGERVIEWGPHFDRATLAKQRMVVVLWGISIDGRVETSPVVRPLIATDAKDRSPEERPLEVRWSWPNTDWHLKIDPRDAHPLQEITPTTR
jgi:hypothetical protein